MASKNGKHYPVVRTAGLTPVGVTDQAIIDLAAEFSKLNRRLMRQGRYYEAKIDLDVGSTPDATYTVLALRDDWAVQKGFQMAYKAYEKATAEERELVGENVARWEDFRVSHGVTNPSFYRANLWDETVAPTGLTAGEFAISRVVDQSNVARTFTWSPVTNSSQYSILGQYDKMGNAQGSPDSPTTTGAYADLEDDIDDSTVSDIQDRGNLPPYDQNGVNSATPWVKIAELGVSATGATKLSTGFFTAPCGLIIIYRSGGANSADLNVTLKSGDYKGVHAPSMLE